MSSKPNLDRIGYTPKSSKSDSLIELYPISQDRVNEILGGTRERCDHVDWTTKAVFKVRVKVKPYGVWPLGVELGDDVNIRPVCPFASGEGAEKNDSLQRRIA